MVDQSTNMELKRKFYPYLFLICTLYVYIFCQDNNWITVKAGVKCWPKSQLIDNSSKKIKFPGLYISQSEHFYRAQKNVQIFYIRTSQIFHSLDKKKSSISLFAL